MQATIIGAGIAGLALAKGLRAVGFQVEISNKPPS
jgi:predicted NAD/FAD-dependent oxidoreductase